MRTRIFSFWYALISSFWFVPSVIVLLSIGLWYSMHLVDSSVIHESIQFWWVYSGGLDGARSLLSAIASSTITVAGTIFSITVVVLSFASRQFGSRILRRFINDRGNQIVLGIFLATFIYCLLLLASLRGIGSAGSVPQAGIMLALMMAAASIGVLIYFIHHIAVSIQSDNVVNSVTGELMRTIEKVYPEEIEKGPEKQEEVKEEPAIPEGFAQQADFIYAQKSGYLQAISLEDLTILAIKKDLIIQIQHRPGYFFTRGEKLAAAGPRERLNTEIRKDIQKTFILGGEQTSAQDIGYSLDRLVQITVSALSPSYNDPFTAITCLDWLGSALCDLAGRKIPSPNHFDNQGKIRVIEKPITFPQFLDMAFNKLHHAIQEHTDVLVHLLDKMILIAKCTYRKEDRQRLIYHANELRRISHEKLSGASLQRVDEHYQSLNRALVSSHLPPATG
jgi:uncharacterized membrane protein